jgi:hypothetical protein
MGYKCMCNLSRFKNLLIVLEVGRVGCPSAFSLNSQVSLHFMNMGLFKCLSKFQNFIIKAIK